MEGFGYELTKIQVRLNKRTESKSTSDLAFLSLYSITITQIILRLLTCRGVAFKTMCVTPWESSPEKK